MIYLFDASMVFAHVSVRADEDRNHRVRMQATAIILVVYVTKRSSCIPRFPAVRTGGRALVPLSRDLMAPHTLFACL